MLHGLQYTYGMRLCWFLARHQVYLPQDLRTKGLRKLSYFSNIFTAVIKANEAFYVT